MTDEEVNKKIQSAPITEEGARLVPYPHQDSGEFYPEWDKYGELFEECQTKGHQAKDYVRAYNKFRNILLKQQEKNTP